MEVLAQAQNIVMEHAFTIGIGLLIATVVAGIAWYWMSRGSAKSDVLENQARVNSAEMMPMSPPPQEQPEHEHQDQMEQEGPPMGSESNE